MTSLEPFTVLSVVLFLGIGDPIVSFNTFRIGLELLGDLLDIVLFPTRDLDKRAGAYLIESLRKGRPDPMELFEIVFLQILIDLGGPYARLYLSSILAGLAGHRRS